MKRLLSTFALIVFAAATSFAQGVSGTSIYFPHVVAGTLGAGFYRTTIFLTNPGDSGSLNATILFNREVTPLASPGVPLSLTVTDHNGNVVTGSSISISSLGPGQSVKLVTSGSGPFSSGYASVTADLPISGAAMFANFDSAGRLIAEAGVPASLPVAKQTIFVDTVGGYNVGVAYSNPTAAGSSNVQLRLLNALGVVVATTTHDLGGNNHRAAFPNELFSAVPASQFVNLTGSMQVIGSTPLVALALRYDPSFSIFTTVPPVQIASLLEPAMKWLADRPWGQFAPLARMLASLVRPGRAA
jgi:hypothetical protein